MQEFDLAFDLSNAPNVWWSIAFPLWLFPLIGFAILLFAHKQPNFFWPKSIPARRAFGAVMVLFTLPLAAIVIHSHLSDRARWRNMMEAGEAGFVEGCLDYFHPMPRSGHESEIVAVGGKVFRFSDFNLTTPFNNTQSHGGPINADSAVRIWHDGNAILRLEVKDRACPEAPDPGKSGPPSNYLR